MSQNRSMFSSLRMGGKLWFSYSVFYFIFLLSFNFLFLPAAYWHCGSLFPDQAEVVREKVQDGLSGEMKEISYTQCKIVGNGSFGVVFQTRMMPSGEDAAIKRVLQDKRFKVCLPGTSFRKLPSLIRSPEPWVADYADCTPSQHCRTEGVLLL